MKKSVMFFLIASFLLASCADSVSEDQTFGSVLVDKEEISVDSLLLSQIAGSKKIDGGLYVSFLKPNSKNSLDTVTVLTSENRVLYLKDSSFNYVAAYDCRNSDAKSDIAGGYDTMFVNYGESKKMSYIPYQKIPSINKQLLKSVLSVISKEKDHVLSDTIVSSYKLKAKNFIDGIEFVDASDYPEYVDDPCRGHMEYPEPLENWKYYLENVSRITLPKDTTVDWILVYTDQYGRSDSLTITTQFK